MSKKFKVPQPKVDTAKIDKLRSNNKDFDSLVSEIDTKIEDFIFEKKNLKSFNPKPVTAYSLKIFVKAVPITNEEKETLIKYLDQKYISSSLVSGNYFILKKCWFSLHYKVQTVNISFDTDPDC